MANKTGLNFPIRRRFLLRYFFEKIVLFLLLFLLLKIDFIYGKTDSRLMPVTDLRSGMKGIAKTVFQGTKIESFPVEIIGILKKTVADTDLILIKVNSPYLKKRGIGLVRGMSGSPVYVNGRLIGAIAYGWGFTKEAVAGVVPIHAMLLELPLPQKGAGKLTSPSFIGNSRIEKNVPIPIGTSHPSFKKRLPKTAYLIPLGTLCQVSGVSETGLAALRKQFPFLEFVSFGGISGGTSKPVKFNPGAPELKEGAAVGVDVIRGDINMTAIGTLSYKNGNNVLAFGHPFMLLGKVDYPLSLASIAYVLPSMEFPAKFGSPIAEVGRVGEDRLYAVGGVLGEKAKMVPMTVTVYDNARRKQKTLKTEIIQQKQLLEFASTFVAERAMEAVSHITGEGSTEVEYALYFKGLPVLRKKNLVHNEANIGHASFMDMARSLNELMKNDFQKLNLEKIELVINIRQDIPVAFLRRVMVKEEHLKAGEPVNLILEIQPFGRTVERHYINIPLPQDISGQIMIGISGGNEYEKVRKTIGISTQLPGTLGQLIKNISRRYPSNSLTVQLALPRRAAVIGGEKLFSLPSYILDMVELSGISGITSQPDEITISQNIPWILVGSQTIDISVGRREQEYPLPSPYRKPDLPPSDLPEKTEETSNTFTAVPFVKAPYPIPLPAKPDEKKNVDVTGKKMGFELIARLNQWDKGEFHNVALTDNGSIVLAPFAQETGKVNEPFIWAISYDKERDCIYIGTGFSGKIYKIDHKKEVKLFYDPEETFVNALTVAPNGDLFAGTSNGIISHLDKDGFLKNRFVTGEQHVWTLLFDSDGFLYAGTGGRNGKILRIEPFNKKVFETVASLSQSHLLTMVKDNAGNIFAGTSNTGIVVKVSSRGEVKLLYGSNASAVTALTLAEEGVLYFGTSPDGKIYKREQNGNTQLYYDLPDSHITSIVSLEKDGLLVGTGRMGSLYRISPPGKAIRIVKGEQDEFAFLKVDLSGRHWASSGSGGKAMHFLESRYPKEGEFVSQVIDSGDISLWGNVSWSSDTPPGASVLLETRSGNSSFVDSLWSPWTAVMQDGLIKSPRGRYLQYRFRLSSNTSGESPLVSQFQLRYRNLNRSPKVSLVSPFGGDYISKKTQINFKASDPDGDILAVSFWQSSAGTSWEKVTWEKFSERFSGGTQSSSMPLPMGQNEETQEWDTTTLPDGKYKIKIVASDFPNNLPGEETEAFVESKEIVVDNTPPVIDIAVNNIKCDQTVFIEGKISDNLSPIKEVLFKLPTVKSAKFGSTLTLNLGNIKMPAPSQTGASIPAVPADGMFDSKEERFILRFFPLPCGTYPLEIKGVDMAGNETIKKLSIIVTN